MNLPSWIIATCVWEMGDTDLNLKGGVIINWKKVGKKIDNCPQFGLETDYSTKNKIKSTIEEEHREDDKFTIEPIEVAINEDEVNADFFDLINSQQLKL